MVHVIATIEVAPGKRSDFLTELHRLVPLVRAESGCLEYAPAVDVASGIAVQTAPRPDAVVIIEKWESLEALRTHLGAAHMTEYRFRVKDLVRGVSLQVLQPA